METNDKPIIKSFKIEGLHGYKNVEIDFDAPVRIVIAENGAGKTTILSALHSFLTGNFHNLRNIDFEKISCTFEGLTDPIALEKKNLTGPSLSNSAVSHTVQEILEYTEIDEATLLAYIASEFLPEDPRRTRSSSVGERLYYESPFSWDEVHEKLVEAKEYYDLNMDEVAKNVTKKVKEAIGNTEILYLPTYRRIEKILASAKPTHAQNRRFITNHRQKNYIPSSDSHMNYGLADVEERLSSLTEQVQRRTNLGYREISANIIDDLLLGKTENSDMNISELPDRETLTRFFSRVGGPRQRGVSDLDAINRLYDDEDSTQDSNITTLRYFLSKLAQVVNQTKNIESTIEAFVKKANTYLGSTSDVKALTYDPEEMKVSVINEWTSKEVKLNDLSSGEKQVVSLLSYLFLYPSEKIILVDEPELSLSIDWQTRILVDMVEAPSCKQLLAITHSPFIFDNELDRFGSPLKITRIPSSEVDSGK